MKTPHKYLLATTCKNNYSNKDTDKPFPQSYTNKDSKNNSQSISFENIFRCNYEERMRNINNNCKKYDFVGFNELTKHKEVLERKHNGVFYEQKVRNIIRHSTLSKSKEGHVTSEEMINKFKTVNNSPKKEEIKAQLHHDQSLCRQQRKTLRKAHHNASKSDLCISKMKERFAYYKGSWEKLIKKRKILDNLDNTTHYSKIVSLIQDSDNYNYLSESEVFMKPKYQEKKENQWQYQLRAVKKSDKHLKVAENHAKSKILKGQGVNKYQKESKWLLQKKGKGYFFKRVKETMTIIS